MADETKITSDNGDNSAAQASPVQNSETEERVKQMAGIISNVSLSRKAFIERMLDPRRSIDHECGYIPASEINIFHLKDMYDSEGIAQKVVKCLPKYSWTIEPEIYEDESVEVETEFEKAWKTLGLNLDGEPSWYRSDERSPIWEYLKRVDELSGIGSFGIMLLGVNDGRSLSEPVEGVEQAYRNAYLPKDKRKPIPEPKIPRMLTFIRCFDESQVKCGEYDKDEKSPRFNRPLYYNLTAKDPRLHMQSDGIGVDLTEVKVHWTRVLHITDNLESSELFGMPRMKPVFNRLYDLRKVYGGSAEMFWRGGFPGLSFETHPELGGDVEIDEDALKDYAEEYMESLRRYLVTKGMSVNSLAPQVANPSDHIDWLITAICIVLDIPKGVLMGSERGETRSLEERQEWENRVRYRRNNYLTPRVIRPFINRMIAMKILPEPQEGYCIDWPDVVVLSADDKADVALKVTQAMANYVGGNCAKLMSPLDYISRVLHMTEEEAAEIVKAALKFLEENPDFIQSFSNQYDENGGQQPNGKQPKGQKPSTVDAMNPFQDPAHKDFGGQNPARSSANKPKVKKFPNQPRPVKGKKTP